MMWRRQDSKEIAVKIEVPCNAAGKLILPADNLLVKGDSGKILKIENDGTNNYIMLPAGKEELTISAK